MKVLIMGLPGSGKTTLAEKLLAELHKNGPAEWINADDVRKEFNDWDFSAEGRMRQARRMRVLADRCVAAVKTCPFLIHRFYNPPRCFWNMGALKHFLFGAGVFFPKSAGLKIHWT